MADAPIPAPPARLSRGRAASVVGGRLVLIVALITGVALVASVALLPLVVPAGGLARDTANKLVDVPPLAEALPDPAQRSVIYAADGKTALATIWLDENRRVVQLKDIPKRVRNAVLAIEDDRFYQHDGVDFRGIARAAVTDLRSGRIAQGGSTLTQQLVKLTVTGNSRTIDRKLREAIYAVELERRYTKNEILEYYLNQAYFGEGVYGIATAAQHYFGNTSIKFVSLAQAASLAATIAAPERYKPTAKKSNLTRRNLVLDRMLELGHASAKDVAKAKKEKLRVDLYTPPRRQPYFERYIVDQLLNDPSYNKALGKVGSDERKRKVFQGGLRIYTTLQGPKQSMAARGGPGPDGPVPRRPGRGAGQRRAQHGPDRGPVRGQELQEVPGRPGHRQGRERLPAGVDDEDVLRRGRPGEGHLARADHGRAGPDHHPRPALLQREPAPGARATPGTRAPASTTCTGPRPGR